uniref:Uncharacterized protein n=1 Tax=Parascaris univalens TaxID=6257 RepID=A0A915BZY9_PARUN
MSVNRVENSIIVELLFQNCITLASTTLFFIFGYLALLHNISLCCKKKRKGKKRRKKGKKRKKVKKEEEHKDEANESDDRRKMEKDVKPKEDKKEVDNSTEESSALSAAKEAFPLIPQPILPQERPAFAALRDPNCEVLANLTPLEDPFAANKVGGAQPLPLIQRGEEKVVDMNDPNYQTLAALNQDVIFGRDKQNTWRPPIVAGEMKIVDKADPNYQTLVGLNQDMVFGPDKKKDTWPPITAGEKKVVGKDDPNYQTLRGLNSDLFGPDKRQSLPQIKVGEKKIVATNDPNYQTLAGLNNDEIFMAKDNQRPFGRPAQPIAPYFPSRGENVYGGGYLDLPTNNKEGGAGSVALF